ncbi:cell wall hydrolase ['Paenibacillus yunnanensis' Narsing Rao et al. 2020]|uniref:cell wall hydrolase n=1 Tax=Paenibacillus tengchongensis TaxID=2608684 RepID=UPI00124E7D7E|nr:cell wall hydrolase [Paenibacillus tengchongensis]
MAIFKQNRCIALLVSVILVCFSAIVLMNPDGLNDGTNKGKVEALVVTGHASAASAPDSALSVSSARTITKLKPILYTTAASLKDHWAGKATAEWISPTKLAPAKPAKTEAAKVTATVMKKPPAAKQAVKQADAKGSQTVNQAQTASSQYPPTTLFFSRTKLLSQDQQAEATWSYKVTEEDLLLLQKIVMAEAEGEPYKGKVAVANVVLNRLRSANFPDTVYDVIYQKSQFSPVGNGRIDRVKPNEESIKAVNAALSGVKEVSDDTYFFLSLKLAQDLTVHHSRTYAKTIGNHTFYK